MIATISVNGKQVNCIQQTDNHSVVFGCIAEPAIHFFDITNIASPSQGPITSSDLGAQCNDISLYDKDHIAVASNGKVIDIYRLSDQSHSSITLTPNGNVLSLANLSM